MGDALSCLKKHCAMDGELERVPVTYSFVVSVGKSDSDSHHKGSLDFK